MFSLQKKLIVAAALLVSASSQAAVLFERSPAASFGGVQTDGSTPPPYAQLFPAQAGATLDKITWWGWHMGPEPPAGPNAFEVFLGSKLLSGSLTSDDGGAVEVIYRYTLDIVDVVLDTNDTTLSLLNNSEDVQWAWQYATAGNATNGLTAFRLEGTPASTQNVPEPGVLGLFGCAAILLSLARRRKT